MARVTVEDCVDKIDNRFDLVLLAAHRARLISSGQPILVDRDKDKNPVVAQQEGRGNERRQSILGANLLQRTRFEVVDPEVRRGLGIGLLKRLAGTVPPRLHAQEQDSMPIGEERAWLPGNLVRDIEFQVTEAAAVGVYQRGLAL